MNSLISSACIFGALIFLIQGRPEALSCNFEEGVCLWQNTANSSDWVWANGDATGPAEKPVRDVTISNHAGHYIYAALSNISSETPTFLSPRVHSGTYCFVFYVYSTSAITAGVRVSTIENDGDITSVKVARANSENEWRRARLELHVRHDFQIQLEAVIENSAAEVIAIDEIHLTSGHCH